MPRCVRAGTGAGLSRAQQRGLEKVLSPRTLTTAASGSEWAGDAAGPRSGAGVPRSPPGPPTAAVVADGAATGSFPSSGAGGAAGAGRGAGVCWSSAYACADCRGWMVQFPLFSLHYWILTVSFRVELPLQWPNHESQEIPQSTLPLLSLL